MPSSIYTVQGAGASSVNSSNVVHEYYSNPVYEQIAKADPSNIQQVAASQLDISNLYYQSVLKQAQQSFRAAIVAATAGLAFFIAAITLLVVAGKLNAAIIGVISGGVVETISGLNFWLYSRTTAQLDAFHVRLEQTQRYLLANSVCESVSPDERDKARSGLIRVMTESQVRPGWLRDSTLARGENHSNPA